MTQQVDALKAAFEAFNRRDIEEVLSVCDPHIDWTAPPDLPGSRTYHGHAGVREAIADMVGVFDDLQADPVRVIERGNRVVGLYVWRGSGSASGVSIDPFAVEVGFVCDFADGLVRSIRFWNGFEDAAEAAGLDPDEAHPTA